MCECGPHSEAHPDSRQAAASAQRRSRAPLHRNAAESLSASSLLALNRDASPWGTNSHTDHRSAMYTHTKQHRQRRGTQRRRSRAPLVAGFLNTDCVLHCLFFCFQFFPFSHQHIYSHERPHVHTSSHTHIHTPDRENNFDGLGIGRKNHELGYISSD